MVAQGQICSFLCTCSHFLLFFKQIKKTVWISEKDSQLKKYENTHGGVLLLINLQALFCNFTSNIPPWVFFKVFLIVQIIPNRAKGRIFKFNFKGHRIHHLK